MASRLAAPKTIVAELTSILGDRVIVDADELRSFETDWTGRFTGRASCAVLPETSAELVEVMRALSAERARFLVQGGNTGLVGGATPVDGEVVVSTRRLEERITIDPLRGEALVGAGVTLAALQKEAAVFGLDYPVDFASRHQATIGGSIATNAAGLRALRFGRTERRVLALEGLLPDGSRLDRRTDASPSLVGSEGVLGVITRARLKLEPHRQERATALVATADIEAAAALAQRARSLSDIESFEFTDAETAELLAEQAGSHPPLAGTALVVIELAGTSPVAPSLESFLISSPEARTWELATGEEPRRALWRWREGVSEAVSRVGVPHKFDVAVPAGSASSLVLAARRHLARRVPSARLYAFGHLAEGRIHLNVVGLEPGDLSIDKEIYGVLRAQGGGVISEHGIGRLKADEFVADSDPTVLAALVNAKLELDPGLLLNRGVLLSAQLFDDSAT